MRLNLGCGEKYLVGWVNVDVLPQVKADRHFDLNVFPWPVADSLADEILMDNVLEHLRDIPSVMCECHRILVDGGVLIVKVPYGKTDWAMQDPTHLHFFTERSLDYFIEGDTYSFYTSVRYKMRSVRLVSDNHSVLQRIRNLIPFRRILRMFLFNMYDVLVFQLEKIPSCL